MKISFRRILGKSIKVFASVLLLLVLLLFLVPYLFSETAEKEVKYYINENIDGTINFSKARLSFFTHFPSLTLSLYDFTLKGSSPFSKDTLMSSKEVGLGIDISSLIFESHVYIDKIYIDQADVQVLVNKKGEANYNVFQPDENANASESDSSASLQLELVSIENSRLRYNDSSLQLFMKGEGLNYTGKGDLNKQLFRLLSELTIDSFDLSFDNELYLKDKKIKANLITQINTNSLSFLFEQNKIYLNKLPVDFTGAFDFLENGYDLNFEFKSLNTDFEDIIAALPPQYNDWVSQTKFGGKADFQFLMKGKYIASEDKMPDIKLEVKIRQGLLQHEGAPAAISNLHLDFKAGLPSFSTDSLQLSMDSLYFNIQKDYLAAVVRTKGIDNPFLFAKVNASMDLDKLDKALGLNEFDMKGKCNLLLTADGQYRTGVKTIGKKKDTTVLSIPSFQVDLNLKDGYFKDATLPMPLQQINADLQASCKDHDFLNTTLSVRNFTATSSNNSIKAGFSLSNLKTKIVDGNVFAHLQLSELKKLLPIDDPVFDGVLDIDIKAKGKYDGDKGIYPVISGGLSLNKGYLKTSYYPNPIKNIQIKARAISKSMRPQDQSVNISRLRFDFEGKPFELKASFSNPSDLNYDIAMKGEVILDHLYHVFSESVPEIRGEIKANFHVKGRQSDAENNRYEKLYNEGTLQLRNFITRADYLPFPFEIQQGDFKFIQDKMWFTDFLVKYGQSDLKMNGYMQNVPAYFLTEKAVLAGDFALHSNFLNADQFMSVSEPASNETKPTQSSGTGVILVPDDLDLKITATVNKLLFSGTTLSALQGELLVLNSSLSLQNGGFKLAGSEMKMNASYVSNGMRNATFDFNVQATDFDVKKMYDSVKLFREMVTSAGKAQGIVSLEYQLKGKLDKNMQPIFPSLEGGGVLSVKKVKVKGLRLLNAISKSTGEDKVADPDISKVNIKTTVKNNVITLERFKIKMAGFRLRMEGQSSFDGQIKFKMRLGLPPLGIIGIPMQITGTQSNPKIKLGNRDREDVEETEYQEEE